MRRLHAAGYPVPIVYRSEGPDLVMARLVGPTMAEAFLAGAISAIEAGEVLAGLHDRLHDIASHPGKCLLHLDLHPANVIMTEDGPVVIDWCNAEPGAPSLDVAMTVLIMAQAATTPPPELAGVTEIDLAEAVRSLLATFVRNVSHSPTLALNEAVVRRRVDPHLTDAELLQFNDAVAFARSI